MKRKKIVTLAKLFDAGGFIRNDKPWFVYYSVRNPKTNQMKRFKERGGLNRLRTAHERYKLADEIISELNHKLRTGWNPFANDQVIYEDELQYSFAAQVYGRQKASNKTYAYFASEYIKSINGLEHDTVLTYKSKLRIFAQWLDAKGYAALDISAITNNIVQQFFHYLIDVRKLSANSTNKYKRLITAVFDLAVLKNNITANPVHHIPVNKRENDQTPRPIHDQDIETFKEQLQNDMQLYLAVLFQYYCYIRPGHEIRFMKVKWIDWGRQQITVPKDKAKTKTDKVITIPDQLFAILREQYKLHTYNREMYVFSGNGQPGYTHLGKNNLRNRFTKIRKHLGMPWEYKFYSWKHTGNVRARDAGIDIIDRQLQNGHKSPLTTEAYTKNKAPKQSPAIRHLYPSL